MENRTSTFFEVTCRYTKRTENGEDKKVAEVYVIDALTFTEAESKATNHAAQYYSDIEVRKEAIAPYREVYNLDAEKFYRCKVAFLVVDEKTAKEKQTKVTYLVGAKDTEDAQKVLAEALRGSMMDYKVLSVAETKIVEVVYE